MKPLFPAGEPDHLRLRWRAAELLRDGKPDLAIDALDEADSLAPEPTGYIDGMEFEGWRDTDELYATILEVFIADRPAWLPFEALRGLTLHGEEAELLLPSNEIIRARLPACYPGSDRDERPEIRDGTDTDWHSPDDGPVRGLGLRVWLFGEAEVSPGDFTRIEVAPDRISLV